MKEKYHSDNIDDKYILVIGDIIIDEYIFTKSYKNSEETLNGIYLEGGKEYRLGGAGNVYANIISLGYNANLVGVVGKDDIGKNALVVINSICKKGENYVVEVEDRPTTKKTRIVYDNTNIIRIDHENNSDINDFVEHELYSWILNNINKYQIVIISDYRKGVLKGTLINNIMRICKDKKIIVDTKNNFYAYKGAYLLKPNIFEFSNFVGESSLISDNAVLEKYANEVLSKGNFEYLYITMGKRGGLLFNSDEKVYTVPPFVSEECVDPIGAGDVALASLGIALINSNDDIFRAVNYASYVSGISTSRFGTSVVNYDDLNKQ